MRLINLKFIGVKCHAPDSASRAPLPRIVPGTVVISMINGLGIAERIGAVTGMEHMLDNVVAEDGQEGSAAFLEKRVPQYKP